MPTHSNFTLHTRIAINGWPLLYWLAPKYSSIGPVTYHMHKAGKCLLVVCAIENWLEKTSPNLVLWML